MDINGSEFLVIALLAVILVGPERLPEYVRGLRSVVLKARGLLRDGQDALKEELGTDVDWNQLDPRNYDPRRIVREALFDDENTTTATSSPLSSFLAAGGVSAAAKASGAASYGGKRPDASGGPPGADAAATDRAPFDPDAT